MIKKSLILSCILALNCQTILAMESEQEFNQRISKMEMENIYNRVLSCFHVENKNLDEISLQKAYEMAQALYLKKNDQILELLQNELFFDLTVFPALFESEIENAFQNKIENPIEIISNNKNNKPAKKKSKKNKQKEIKIDEAHKFIFDSISNSKKEDLLNENHLLTDFFERQENNNAKDLDGKTNIVTFFTELRKGEADSFSLLSKAHDMFVKKEGKDEIKKNALSECEKFMILAQHILPVKNIFTHNDLNNTEQNSSFQQLLSLFLIQNRDYKKITVFLKEKTKNHPNEKEEEIANSTKMVGVERNVQQDKMNKIIASMSSLTESEKHNTQEFKAGLLYWQQAFSFLMVLDKEENLVFGAYRKYAQYFFRSFFESQLNHRGDENAFLNNGYKAFLVLFGFITGDLDLSESIIKYDENERIINKDKKK